MGKSTYRTLFAAVPAGLLLELLGNIIQHHTVTVSHAPALLTSEATAFATGRGGEGLRV